MPTINFNAGAASLQNLNGMGLGFYGPGNFGSSVQVGQWAQNTYITDPTGGTQGAKCNNVQYISPNSGSLGTSDTHNLLDIPNDLATLNISFVNSTPCLVQNATLTFFDRNNVNNPPVGVAAVAAEIVHTSTTMGSPFTGSGSTTWYNPGGSGGTVNSYVWDPPMALSNSPGVSGSTWGTNTASTQHDWYVALSQSPMNIGSQVQNALFVSLEYL